MGSKSKIRNKYFSYDYVMSMPNRLPADLSSLNVPADKVVACSYTRTGSDNPNYKTLIKQGSDATNPMTVVFTDVKFEPGLLQTKGSYPGPESDRNLGYVFTNQGIFPLAAVAPPSTDVASALVSAAQNKAAIRIRQAIQAETQAFSGMTFLGELRESIHMLRHPASAAREYLQDYLTPLSRKRLKVSRHKFRDVLANSWLEFSFGWRPLLADVTAIANSINDVVGDEIRRVHASAVEQSAITTTERIGVTSTVFSYDFNHTTRQKVVHTYRCGVKRQSTIGKGSVSQIIDHGGFDLANVIPTAWELLPWSFFIDYFSNIGDVISADLVSLENVVWTCSTSYQENSDSYTSGKIANAVIPNLAYVINEVPCSFKASRTKIVRTAGSVPLPTLRFELPGRDSQFLNIGALLQLRF